MSRASVLARGRAAAEAGMVDACTIRRVTGTATDPATGAVTPTYQSPDLYSGPCRFQQGMVQTEPHDVGEDFVRLLRLELQLPMTVIGLEVNDVVTCVSSVSDPDLPGRTFLVRDLAHKTDATARRVQLTERTGS
jgi:hypothetical protein